MVAAVVVEDLVWGLEECVRVAAVDAQLDPDDVRSGAVGGRGGRERDRGRARHLVDGHHATGGTESQKNCTW